MNSLNPVMATPANTPPRTSFNTPPGTPQRTPQSTPQKSQARPINLDTPQRSAAFQSLKPAQRPVIKGLVSVSMLSMDKAYRTERLPGIHPCPDAAKRAVDALIAKGDETPSEDDVVNQLKSVLLPISSKVEYLDDPSYLKLTFVEHIPTWKNKHIGWNENRTDDDFHPKLIYVVDEHGQFYCHGIRYEKAPLQRKSFHHSSFFGSGRVQAAGVLSISTEGNISAISNSSGHYKPTVQHLVYAVQLLKHDMLEQDFNLLKVEFFDENGAEKRLLAPQFLQENLPQAPVDRDSKKRKYA